MKTQTVPHMDAILGLCETYHVSELYAFGSAVTGGFKENRSDFDFLVQFQPCTPTEHADRYFGFLESLQDLLGTQVDLVEMGAVTNRRFEQSVAESRVAIYAA